MPRYTLSTILAVAAASSVYAQKAFPDVPLAEKRIEYKDIPYQVDTDTDMVRGGQSGYNLCNSTTEGQSSMCQTSFLNSLDDFCLWSAPKPASTIGETEHEEVAWCTKPGHGTRVIPKGALQGVQFIKTPDYVQVVGFIDQTGINLQASDYGGELDPHGADLRGNPLGGLVYSNAFTGNNDTYKQVVEWNNFMGGGGFCMKACKEGPHAADFCQHIFDRIGCAYNSPNNAKPGVFEACEGESQDYPGIYTENGVVKTYTQPAESLGAISTMPYQPKVPASSNCVAFKSEELYAAAATILPTAPLSSLSSSPTGSGSARPSGSGSSSRSASGPGASGTSVASNNNNGASGLAVSSLVSVMGVAFAVAFFA